jgi:hypothetical protein
MVPTLLADLLRLLSLTFRSRARLAAKNPFLRKQLAHYVERKFRPKRATNATRVALVLLSRFVAWPEPDDSTRRPALTGHQLPSGHRVVSRQRLGGLHHHYSMERVTA